MLSVLLYKYQKLYIGRIKSIEFVKYLILIGLTLVVFLLVDIVWLAKISPKFYKKYLGHLMADKVNFPPAIIFYLIFVIGSTLFVTGPAVVDGRGWVYAVIYGGIFGFVTYSTYDLTNYATLKSWPLKVTLIDIVWGTFLSTATSTIVYFIAVLLGV